MIAADVFVDVCCGKKNPQFALARETNEFEVADS